MITIAELITLGAHLAPKLVRLFRKEISRKRKMRGWTRTSERAHQDDFVLAKRNQEKIYDLEKTIVQLRSGLKLVLGISQNKGSVLFVLPQVERSVKDELKSLNQYYICSKWIAGLLTNFNGLSSHLAVNVAAVKGVLPKDYYLPTMPHAVILLNPDDSVSRLVVQETSQLHIPLIALLTSHSKIPYPIASKNNSLAILAFYRSLFMRAVVQGKKIK